MNIDERKKILTYKSKVNYYVQAWQKEFRLNLRQFQMDEQASYSITAAHIAKKRDREILMGRHGIPQDVCIFDGMACVGGDSLSFMCNFEESVVISNEYDMNRYNYLFYNMELVRTQLSRYRGAQMSRLGNVLDFWNGDTDNKKIFEKCNALYLDPEWGGVGYQYTKEISLSINDHPLDECVLDAFNASKKLHWVILKLPCNYDKNQIMRIIAKLKLFANSYKFVVHNKEKMVFVVLERADKYVNEIIQETILM